MSNDDLRGDYSVPCPASYEDCLPVADEVARLISAALREVGVDVVEYPNGGYFWPGARDEDLVKAQRVALLSLRIPFAEVPLETYIEWVRSVPNPRPVGSPPQTGCWRKPSWVRDLVDA